MIIVIGLGNVGQKYAGHRHNIGFQTLDHYALKEGVSFREEKVFSSHIASLSGDLLFAKPDTFMNHSGIAAKALLKQYESPLVVVYDDIDIALGEVKCSFGRGAGGHNGVQSIIDHLGHKDFFRIRIGVRPVHEVLMSRILPPHGFETYLLSDFAPFEYEKREEGIMKAHDIIRMLQTKSFEEIMNDVN